MNKQCYIYIMTCNSNKALYIGVTNDLIRRVREHKNKVVKGFTSRYNVDRLVYYEVFEDIENAIIREKQLKGGNRRKKEALINGFNPQWKDLYDSVII